MADMPVNIEAEYAVIGTLLLGVPGDWDRARAVVGPEDFYRASFALIFQAMDSVAMSGEPPDAVTVYERLTSSGRIEDAGGRAGIFGLLDSPLSGQNVEAWAKIVRDKADRRRVIEDAELATKAALDPTVAPQSIPPVRPDAQGYLEDLPPR